MKRPAVPALRQRCVIYTRVSTDAVQSTLDANRNHRAEAWRASGALLTGKIFDDRGNRMSPSFAVKTGARYRYYTSCALIQRRKYEAGSVARVPAADVEEAVIAAVQDRAGKDPLSGPGVPEGNRSTADPAQTGGPSPRQMTPDEVRAMIGRVVIRQKSIDIAIASAPFAAELEATGNIPASSASGQDPSAATLISIPWQPAPRTRLRQIHRVTDACAAHPVSPIRAEARARLLMAIAKARLWLELRLRGEVTSTFDLASRQRVSERSVRQTLPLAFLAPVLVKAVAEGNVAHGMGIKAFSDVPIERGSNWQV